MEPLQPTYLYKETRLNLEPAYSASTIAISLPSGNSSFLTRTQSKRTVLSDTHVEQDEDAFAKRHLATEASIYFRRIHKYPRSFLWRILNDRKVLELRSTDLSLEKFNKEAALTLLLELSAPIKPFGIAFAEPEERDALTVFALTTSNELYTITLHKDFFVKPAASEAPSSDWCKTFMPSSFSFRQPYRMVATSAYELVFSLHDGGLLRLNRKTGEDGSSWRETFFSEGGWGTSLKSLIPWKGHNTIRFGNLDLEASTAAGIAMSPDGEHIFSVCLDHTFKAWNLKTGKVGVHRDLLGDDIRDSQKHGSYLIPPSQPQLMTVVEVQGAADGDAYYLVTYSPKKHQFKFWGILDPDHPEMGVRDIASEVEFIPPVDELLNTTVWNLEEFHVKPGPGWRKSEIWIRARSGPNSKIFSLEFDLFGSPDDLEIVWKRNWLSVDAGALTVDNLRSSIDYPTDAAVNAMTIHHQSVSERWLNFLFFPGRFSTSSMETALSIYNRIPGRSNTLRSATLAASRVPLKERLCASVNLNATNAAPHINASDYQAHEIELGRQWQVYYGILRDLHKRRGATLALAFDGQEGTPWLLLADYVSAVRKCSDIESLSSNSALLAGADDLPPAASRALRHGDQPSIACLWNAAHEFRLSLPEELQESVRVTIEQEILRERSESFDTRMRAFDVETGLGEKVTDDDASRLLENLEYFDGFQYLTNDLFKAALRRLTEPERGHHVKRDITHFGISSLMRISQETLQLGYETLIDLLVLVVFMSGEDLVSNEFEPVELFAILLEQLREHYLLLWLAGTLRMNPSPQKQRRVSADGSSMDLDVSQANSSLVPVAETMLETICKDFCFAIEFPQEPQTSLLTYWGRAWTFAPFQSKTSSNIACDVMSALLVHGEYDLASDFEKFLTNDSWPTYLRARLCLAKADYDLAATYFKKAGFGLAEGFFDINDTEGLLGPEEKDYFTEGLSKYYQHVLGLFEKSRAYSYVADFARLALHSLATQPFDPDDSTKGLLKTEFLSRLFNASIQVSRFEEAYSALVRYTNKSLQRQALTTLVTAMITQEQSSTLMHFPFASLSSEVDKILQGLCKKTVNLSSGPPYHKFLFSWRILRNDFRGAASILYERLQLLKLNSSATKGEDLIHCYLLLINTLTSVADDQQWILVEQPAEEHAPTMKQLTIGKSKEKAAAPNGRKIVTLEDIRNEYQAELDRQSALEHGRFAFGGDDDMEL